MAGLMVGISQVVGSEIEWRQMPPLPDAFGFASPFVGTSGKALLLGGGANFPDKPLWDGGAKVWHDEVFALLPGARQWTSAGKLPQKSAYGVCLSAEGGMLCVGGSDATQHFSAAFLLTWEDGTLVKRDLPALPKPLALGSGARVGDLVYIAGGLEHPSDKEPLTTFLVLDLKAIDKGWLELPTWPGPGRFQAVAAASDGWFYLFSGLRPNASGEGLEYLRDAYRYAPQQGWEKLPDLPFPAAAAASPAPVGAAGIYLLGGVDGSAIHRKPRDFYHAPQRIQLYDPQAKRWTGLGNAPVGRVCVSTTEWEGQWILPSGERSPGVRSPEVWSLRIPE